MPKNVKDTNLLKVIFTFTVLWILSSCSSSVKENGQTLRSDEIWVKMKEAQNSPQSAEQENKNIAAITIESSPNEEERAEGVSISQTPEFKNLMTEVNEAYGDFMAAAQKYDKSADDLKEIEVERYFSRLKILKISVDSLTLDLKSPEINAVREKFTKVQNRYIQIFPRDSTID